MTTKKNRYENVKLNVVCNNHSKEIDTVMKKVYELLLNSKANAS